ncbi:hypothetical protein IGI04_035799 [Brassica rapa subsp. trilocularis]|uniref:Uncharacterized protein n=1 Tax=Brassica rapa subsp. trilocularis TaxID=1813537 RepID=A0ABQ7LFK4_BRACM|nr:hypothetical protein IGI04_035799 [Brassica rapa subsp. trilocularis]
MDDRNRWHFTNNMKYSVKSGYQVERVYPDKGKPPDFLWTHSGSVKSFLLGSAVDRPRSTDQYMEPNQPGDQNLEPWPDDRSDHTGACLSRPTSHLKTYGRGRIHFGRAGRGDTYLGELDELSELSDTTLELDELSELNDTSLELNELTLKMEAEQPAVRRKTTRDVADPKRQPFQIDVQQICDNLVKGVDKALKDFSKSQKKSTSTRAPVAEPSLFISKKAQGESENHFEELKDFSDSLPIFDESDEELIESLMFCEKDCDLPSLETEFNLDNEQAIVELTVLQPELPSSLVLSPLVFEEEPLDFPHQCPCLDTRICLDDDLGPIFDEEDEPGPVFDEEATSITSIAMENYLCFDPGTTPAPLPPDLQEHCEKPSSLNSLPDMFVKVSTDDFLEHNKGFHLLGRPFDLDLQQTDFCAEKSLDLVVCKGNGFDLSSSRHVLITDELFASSYALDEILIQKLLEQKSLKTENDFRHLKFCGSVLQPDLLSFETDKTWYFLRSFRDNGVVLSSDDILVYNTFFEKYLELLINDSQIELKLVCSDVGKDMSILKMNTVVAYLDKILVCNIYFDEHLDRLKNMQFVLGKDILICDLNKYLSCTFDPGLLVFILSIQERQVQPLRIESIDRAQQSEFWRSFVETGYLYTSDRGSVQGGYFNIPKAFCHESNFPRKPTQKSDRAVYWTVPHTSGKELWLEPWPDNRSDHTGACLSRPTSHLKTYGRARIHFGRAGRGDTYLGELDELSELSDTILELDELSELNDTSLELNVLTLKMEAVQLLGEMGLFSPKKSS